MGIFKGAVVVAAMVLAAPVWADGGHGHDRGWDDGGRRGHRYHWDRDDYRRGGRYYGHQHRHWDRTPRSDYYNQHYYAPPPAYGYLAPAPGVHIVAPNVYIPFR
jgi:hypothetical protein